MNEIKSLEGGVLVNSQMEEEFLTRLINEDDDFEDTNLDGSDDDDGLPKDDDAADDTDDDVDEEGDEVDGDDDSAADDGAPDGEEPGAE